MQCTEFEDRLNRLLDHRLLPDDDPHLRQHAQDCPACAETFGSQQRLFAGLRSMRVEPADGLAARVVVRQQMEVRAVRSKWQSMQWTALLVTAASLGWVALLAVQGQRAPQQFIPGVAPTAGSVAPRTTPRQASPRTDDLAIASTQGDPAEAQFHEYRRALEDLAMRFGDSAELGEMSESLSPSIRPIQSSFGIALDALRRTLPRSRENSPARPEAGALHWSDLPSVG
jgi:hypothetical protein